MVPKLKILLLAPHPFFQHRGTPISVKLLMEVLSKYGHHIHILTYHEGEDVEDIPNVSIHRNPAFSLLRNIKPGPSWKKLICDLLMFWKCIKIVHKSRFDVIHAVEESVFMAMILKMLFGIPYVYDMDSSIPQQLTEKYKLLRPFLFILELSEKMAVRGSVGVIAVCKSLEKTALRYDSGKKVLRLEDISLLKSDTQEGDLILEKLGISGPIIMYVGNLESYQGIDLLLESFRYVTKRENEVHLVIIGGSETDIQRYNDKSKQLGISDNVHFIGQKPISQLNFYLRQADIVVSPRTKGQNTPMKIYSYLDSGRPIVATRMPTHTQVLDDQIALLVPPEPNAMADGIIKLLQDDTLSTNLAWQAKERVQKEFSYEAFRRKLLTFYDSLEVKGQKNKNSLNSIEKEFDEVAPVYETNRLSAWYKAHGEVMLNVLKHSQNGAILDIGCGTGWLLRQNHRMHQNIKGIGIDISSKMIDIAREKAFREGINNLTFMNDNWEEFDLSDLEKHNITTIVCANVFHYFDDPFSAAKKIFQTLTKGGKFFVLERDKTNSFLTNTWDAIHRILIKDNVRFYCLSELIQFFKSAGFSDVSVERRIKKFIWKGKIYTNLVLITGTKHS